jgi:hypothetical protein
MHLIRHQVVHEGILSSPGGRELAHTAEQTLDAVFEVLSKWLPQPDGHSPWYVLTEVQGRAHRVFYKSWRSVSPAREDPDQIVRR